MGDPQRDYEILAEAPMEVLIESLIDYGFVPELAGRLPIIVPLAPLTKEQMRQALTEPKNAVVRQQIELFARDGIELVITDAALDAIVEKADFMKTGVRALRSLVKGMTSRARYRPVRRPDRRARRSRPGVPGGPGAVPGGPQTDAGDTYGNSQQQQCDGGGRLNTMPDAVKLQEVSTSQPAGTGHPASLFSEIGAQRLRPHRRWRLPSGASSRLHGRPAPARRD